MTEYKYRENINDKDGNTIGCKEIIVPSAIVKQIRVEVINEFMEELEKYEAEINNTENKPFSYICFVYRKMSKEQK